MAIRTYTHGKKRKEKEILMQRWHPRKVIGLGDSLAIVLPMQLVRWDRKRSMDPNRWQPGDVVEVALSVDGQWVIRYSATNYGLGELPAEDVPVIGNERRRRRRR